MVRGIFEVCPKQYDSLINYMFMEVVFNSFLSI